MEIRRLKIFNQWRYIIKNNKFFSNEYVMNAKKLNFVKRKEIKIQNQLKKNYFIYFDNNYF